MGLTLAGIVEGVRDGKLRGQRIVTVKIENGGSLEFDAIEGVFTVSEGMKLSINIYEERPEDIDKFEFCGHGYLVDEEDKLGKTLISVWGILFVFSKKLGLIPNKKYYICISKV